MTTMEAACDLEFGVTVIRLGRDYGSAQLLKLTRLEACLCSALNASPKVILLDLSDTSVIGASFLSVLIRCYTRSTRINCRFALCMLQAFPASVASITRLNSKWLIYSSRQVAVEALRQPFLSGTQTEHR